MGRRLGRATITSMIERPPSGEIPHKAGAYLFRDARGRVIYVGKAKSLRKRLANYFGPDGGLEQRTLMMLREAESVEWLVAQNEVEAIFLEFNLINEYEPKFNILLRDDKSFPFLGVTLDEEWPRPGIMRGRIKKGVRYYGPYAHAHSIRETLDLLLRTFPLRTCSNAKLKSHRALGRPCLYFHIDRCAGPCVDKVTADEYRELVDRFCHFLDGDFDEVLDRLEREMASASADLEFERAARKRDELDAVRRVIDRQRVLSARNESFDAIAIADDELEASIQVFGVKRGRLVGRRGYVIEKTEEVDRPALMALVLEELYGGVGRNEDGDSGAGGARPHRVPRQILVDTEPAGIEVCRAFLRDIRGGPVEIRVPLRGEKRDFLSMVRQNADEAFVRHKMKRAADHATRSKALTELQRQLGLADVPLRIECFDISNTGADEIVGSMVVMEDGLPKPREYRRFKVRGQTGPDDFAAMEEVVRRRFAAYLREMEEAAADLDPTISAARSERPRKFSYPPGLLLIDGGPGQVNAALKALEGLGIDGIRVAGLAKRFEEIYLPARPDPVILDRRSEALYLLQTIRDEAHRFAITYHRKLRGKKMVASALDEIPGLGEARKKKLLKHFGSLKRVRAASPAELSAVEGIPSGVADATYRTLHPESLISGRGSAVQSAITGPVITDPAIDRGELS